MALGYWFYERLGSESVKFLCLYMSKVSHYADTISKCISPYQINLCRSWAHMSQLMSFLGIYKPEPSLFTHMKYGSWRIVWPKIRHLAPLDGGACVFEEWVRRKKSTIISWHGSFVFFPWQIMVTGGTGICCYLPTPSVNYGSLYW